MGMRAEGAGGVEGRVGVGRRLGFRLGHHRVPPGHLGQHVLARGRVRDDGLHHGRAGGRDDGLVVLRNHLGLLAGHGLVVEVGHQHGGSIEVLVLVHGVVVGFDALERRGAFNRRRLRGPGVGSLVGRPSLLLAGQRRAAILCVDGAVVAQEEVATHKGAAALEALEGALFRVCSEGQLATPFSLFPAARPRRECPASVNSYPAPNNASSIATLGGGLDDLRERSWRLRCSLLLKARLQNWHLYFFSGAPVLRTAGEELDAIAGGLEGGSGQDAMSSRCRPLREAVGDGRRAWGLKRVDG